MSYKKLNARSTSIGIIQSKFVEFIKNHPIKITNSNFSYTEDFLPIFGDNKIQSFPTFIQEEIDEEFKEASINIRKIIDKIPGQVFKSDFKKIYDYYDMSQFGRSFEKFESIFNIVNTNSDYMVSRGDFIMTLEGLKCIEFNFGTDLGGWENKIGQDLYLNNELIADFIEENQLTPIYQDTLSKMFDHIIKSIIKNVKELENDVNTVFFYESGTPKTDYFTEIYDQCIKNFEGMRGELFFSNSKELYVEEDKVYLNNKRVACIVDIGHACHNEVYECFKMKNIIVFNGPISHILGNKLNFALLHDENYNHVFSSYELELIKKYIPYAFRIEPENFKKLEQVIEHKSNWVLKPGQGFSGKDVYVGKEVSQDRWNELIESARDDRNSIVQEFCEPPTFLYLDKEGNIVPHHTVFGFFVFGHTYADGFIRFSRLSDSLVINVSLGAEKGFFLKVGKI